MTNCTNCKFILEKGYGPLCRKCTQAMIVAHRPSFIKGVVRAEPKKCRMCPTMLPAWLSNYCSGNCMIAAKFDGSYGKEELAANKHE